MSTKYYLEIDVSGYEAPCDEGRWLGYDLIITEGNTLQECLENASIGLTDQDGGEVDQRPADEDWMSDIVEKAFMAKFPPNGSENR